MSNNFCNEAIIISTETHWRYNHSNLDCNLTNLYYNTKESYVILNAIIEKRFKAFTQTFTENCSLLIDCHCVKSVQIQCFFWSVFSVSVRIQSECGKMRTRKNSAFGHFSHCVLSGVSRKVVYNLNHSRTQSSNKTHNIIWK